MSEPLLEIGRIDKPHGIDGEVAVTLVSNRDERLARGSVFQSDRGPLEVVDARPHKGRHLITFAGIASREAADELRGLVLRAPPIDDPDEMWVHELIGAVVVDQSGVQRGLVVQVVANPASDLLELDSGALVPFRFVVDTEPGVRIDVDVPDGLFELDE